MTKKLNQQTKKNIRIWLIYGAVRQTRPVSIEIICHFLLNNSSLVCRRLGLYLQTQIKLIEASAWFFKIGKKETELWAFLFNSYLLSCFFLTNLIVVNLSAVELTPHHVYFYKTRQFPALRFLRLRNFTLNNLAIYKLIFGEKHVIRGQQLHIMKIPFHFKAWRLKMQKHSIFSST